MFDYQDHYLKKDVLLLAGVFEKFTSESFKFKKKDLSHYFNCLGLSWDTMLKMTGIKLKLISDINNNLFLEKGLRGGVFYICKRFSEENNKYMKNYGPTKESKLIMYINENNLYVSEMTQFLPCI